MNATEQKSQGNSSWINVLLGIWVLISPFILGFARVEEARWNNVAVGVAVIVVALTRASGRRSASILNMLLGFWLIISPFVLGFANGSVALRHNIILGVIIAIVALVARFERMVAPVGHQ